MTFMRLDGRIECRATPASVTLVGHTESGGRVHLTLATAATADLPAVIEEGAVELLDGGRCRISAPGREWLLLSPRTFLHHDASRALYAALPPRRVPLAKRLLWHLVLAVAASRAGRRWLGRARRAA
jgi:hypothetical protein